MKNHFRVGMAVLAIGFLAGGCVSSGTFDQMVTQKDGEIAALQQQKAALEDQAKALEQQRNKLEQDKAALQQETASLEQKRTQMAQQVGSLEQQKSTLLATSQQRQQQYEALVQGLSKEVEKGQLQVRQYQNMLAVDLAEQIFFDSGSATLKKEGKAVLQKVGEALKGYDNKIIRVVGHTDNVPLARSLQEKFPSNWELSVARATNVVRNLQEVGIPPERMAPSGRGEYDPIAPNDTADGRKKNRRIEIMLIDKSLASEMTKPSN